MATAQSGSPAGLVFAERPEASLSAAALRKNFTKFALCFSFNHSMVTTPLVVASSVLNGNIGYQGNAALYACTCVSSIIIGGPAVGLLGIRGGVVTAMGLYCVYVGLFAVATVPDITDDEQRLAFVTGSCAAGTAAGILWTAQGSYFSRTVDLIARSENIPRTEVTTALSGRFAFYYLLFEVLAKLSWSGLSQVMSVFYLAAFYAILSALPTAYMFRGVEDLWLSGPRSGCLDKARATVSLWTDPVVFLIGGVNVTFGFSAAFVNGYVNKEYASPLGSFAAPLLQALTVLCAAGFSRVLGLVGNSVGKGATVSLGALCFASIALCLLALNCCHHWGWWLAVLYVLQGTGRAVYEATSKGVFSDFFPNEPVGAFSNCMLQSSLSFTICFLLSSNPQKTNTVLPYIVLALSVLTPVGYFGATKLRSGACGRRQITQSLIQ